MSKTKTPSVASFQKAVNYLRMAAEPKSLGVLLDEQREGAEARTRASVIKMLRHWASLSGAFEDNDGAKLLLEFAERIEAREDLLPDGHCYKRKPGDIEHNADEVRRILAETTNAGVWVADPLQLLSDHIVGILCEHKQPMTVHALCRL